MSKKFLKGLLSFVAMIMLVQVVFTGALTAQQQEHKKLEYEVEVKATLIPLFALDKEGNSIFDLKKEELEVFINGKPVNIQTMSIHRFDESEKTVAPEAVPQAVKEPRRVIFIVLDSLNATFHGLDKGKRIAMELVRKANPGDSFVILEVTLQNGLKYIAGPEKSSEALIKRIKKWKLVPGQTVARDFLTEHASKIAVNHFVYSISQLKYALKTITRPKILFLISEGIPEKEFEQEYGYQTYAPSTLRYYFGDMIKAINEGGCVFNVIYPGRRTTLNDVTQRFMTSLMFMRNTSEWMLKYIGIGSGGAFYNAPNIKDLVTSVKKTTAAYYELAVVGDPGAKEKQRVVVKTKRKGIVLHTLNYSEKEKEYKEMKLVQKKVFAINVASGGTWSRMVAKVQKTKYKKLSKQKEKGGVSYKIEVPIPEELQNKKTDIYLLRFDKNYAHTDINHYTNTLGQTEEVEISSTKGKKLLYFVIIEPESTYTVYGQVK